MADKKINPYENTQPVNPWENTAQLDNITPLPEEPEEEFVFAYDEPVHRKKKSSQKAILNLYGLLLILLILIGSILMILYLQIMRSYQAQATEQQVTMHMETTSVIVTETESMTASATEPTTESTTQPATEPTTEPVTEPETLPYADMYAAYYQAMLSYNCIGGCLADVDMDGMDNLILHVHDGEHAYVIFSYDMQGTVISHTFGSPFYEDAEHTLYQFTGTDNSSYLFYQVLREAQRIDGYYHVPTQETICICMDYAMHKKKLRTEWEIIYTDASEKQKELDSDKENVEDIYDLPTDGIKAFMKRIEKYDFALPDTMELYPIEFSSNQSVLNALLELQA